MFKKVSKDTIMHMRIGGKMHLNSYCKGHAPIITIGGMVLILFLAGVADATTAIWDEELASPLPYTWNYTNFDGFNISGIGTENLTILQATLSANQSIIDKDNLTYTTTAQAKKLNVVTALNLINDTDMTAIGLEQAAPGMAFDNGQYYVLNWQAQKYVALNGKVDKLTKQVIEQGISEKKIMMIGERWDIGDGWALTANSIDANASPRQVWFTLSQDGIKKDDRVVAQGMIYTYVENSTAGENNVPLFVTYVDSIFSGATSDLVQLKYTWAISTSVTTITSGDTYSVFNQANVNGTTKTMALRNDNTSVILSPNATINLIGNIKFKVVDNTTCLKFYLMDEPKLNITASPVSVPIGVTTNVFFAVKNNGSAVSGAFVNLSGAAVGSGVTDTNGQATISINASYNGTIIAEAGKEGYSNGAVAMDAYPLPYSSPVGGGGGNRTYPTNNSIFVNGEMIMLSGSARGGTPPFTYNWTSSIDGLIGSVSKILTFSLSPGTHVITLNITDINGTTDTSSRTIIVYPANTSIVSGINATGPMTWNISNLPAFWQEGDNTSEELSVAAINDERNISMEDLYYNSTRQLMPYKAYSVAGKTVDYGLDSNGNKVPSGSYYAKIGWFGEPYVVIVGKANKLAKLVLEQNETSSKTLGVGETWNMGYGWILTAEAIDAKASPRQVWLTLSKDGVKKDDRIVYQGDVYTYVENSFAGETGVPLFATYIDSIFVGATSDIVQLRYTWLVSGNPMVINAGDKIGILTAIETNNTGIKMSNLNYNITLTQGSTINIADGLRFKVNNTPTLDYYPEMNIIGSMLPFWTPIPTNQTVELGASFSYDINATGLQTITYSVDDTTNFSVNPSTGLITNATALSIGIYWLNITATDASGNSISQVITVIVRNTIPPANNNNGGSSSSGSSSSGGGGGGGGGGGTSGEDFSNIEIKEKYDLYISKDKVTSYTFTNKSNNILFVNITGNISAGEITTTAEVLRNTSSLVKNPAPGIVYKNINIWVGTSGFAVPKNIKEAVIKFKVENSWLNNNDLAEGDVKMFRWDGSRWNALETLMKDNDNRFTYFEAKTNAFSPFAIVGVIKSALIQPTQPTPQQTQIAALVPDITASNTQYENATGFLAGVLGFALPKGGSSVSMALIIALLIIVVIYRLILRKRK